MPLLQRATLPTIQVPKRWRQAVLDVNLTPTFPPETVTLSFGRAGKVTPAVPILGYAVVPGIVRRVALGVEDEVSCEDLVGGRAFGHERLPVAGSAV